MGVCLDLQRYDICEVFVFLMKLMRVWYEMSYDVHIDHISIWKSWVWYFILFHVTCFYIYNIYWTDDVEFLSIYYMCMLCERIVIYQCTCVFVHDYGNLYCHILYLYDISYFLMFQHSSVMCYCMEYWHHIWYITF